jgi:hypothetical protein
MVSESLVEHMYVVDKPVFFFLVDYVAVPQYGDYTRSVIGWLMNVELLVE